MKELPERKRKNMRRRMSSQIAPKRIQHLRIHLTNEVKDLYSENYKTLMNPIEDDT